MNSVALLEDVVNGKTRREGSFRITKIYWHMMMTANRSVKLHRALLLEPCAELGPVAVMSVFPPILDGIIMTRPYIRFPFIVGEQANIKRQFAAMPNLTKYDCTHIGIRPVYPIDVVYVNRKHVHSSMCKSYVMPTCIDKFSGTLTRHITRLLYVDMK